MPARPAEEHLEDDGEEDVAEPVFLEEDEVIFNHDEDESSDDLLERDQEQAKIVRITTVNGRQIISIQFTDGHEVDVKASELALYKSGETATEED